MEFFCFYSGYGYSYPLQRKSDAVQRLQNLIQRLHNVEYYLSRIQVYVSDHSGETIMTNDFQDFLAQHGIFWQTAPRNTPNYNAIVERNIQTLKTIMRALHLQVTCQW